MSRRRRRPAHWHVALMYQQIVLSRGQMPVIEMAGQAAARRTVNGGFIWAGGSQGDFGAEAIGRAGGLMGVKPLDLSQVFRKDVVLYAPRGALSEHGPGEHRALQNCRCICDCICRRARLAGTPTGPDLLIDCGSLTGLPTGHGICPLDTVTNIMNLWVFTGEYVAACTRMGKTPVLYKSYGLDGGRERDGKYDGQLFHDDISVAPVRPGVLGNAYLDRINKILSQLEHEDLDDITQAGRWLAGSNPADTGAQFIAHIYPDQFRDPRGAADSNHREPAGTDSERGRADSHQLPAPSAGADRCFASRTHSVVLLQRVARRGGLGGEHPLMPIPIGRSKMPASNCRGTTFPFCPPAGLFRRRFTGPSSQRRIVDAAGATQ